MLVLVLLMIIIMHLADRFCPAMFDWAATVARSFNVRRATMGPIAAGRRST